MPDAMKRAKEIVFGFRRVAEKPRKEIEKEIVFSLRRVAEKPIRAYPRKGSKYAPILDQFMEGEHDIVEVEAENMDANRLRFNLVRVIEERGLEDRVKASVRGGVVYLEKV